DTEWHMAAGKVAEIVRVEPPQGSRHHLLGTCGEPHERRELFVVVVGIGIVDSPSLLKQKVAVGVYSIGTEPAPIELGRIEAIQNVDEDWHICRLQTPAGL